jgi:predicted transcriptional regulator
MMRALSDLLAGRTASRAPALGPLESEVLDVLWASGEGSVRDVLGQLHRPLAYTTVMTTLDRLYKKGLLERRMTERTFRYVPCLPRATELVAAPGIFQSQAARDLLVSHLVDTVCAYDDTLLAELERGVAERRRQVEARAAEAGQQDLQREVNGGEAL